VALTVALALGSLPGLVGARESSPEQPIDAAAFRQVILATLAQRPNGGGGSAQAAGRSAGALDARTSFVEPGSGEASTLDRANVALPNIPAAWSWKPPKYSLSGEASFYSYGTTAMRNVPRGTTVVICGAGGCIQRVVNDYGPAASTGRIIDMYKPDFFAVCGCPWFSGTTQVTVKVY
jgi:hypothetical protein